LIALDVIKKTYTLPLKEGLKEEKDTFIANIPQGFNIAKDLIALFFIQEAAKKDPGIPAGAQRKRGSKCCCDRCWDNGLKHCLAARRPSSLYTH